VFVAVTLAVAAPWYLFVFNVAVWKRVAGNDPTFPHYDYVRNVIANWENLGAGLGWPLCTGLYLLLAVAVIFGRGQRGRLLLATAAFIAVPLAIMSLPPHLEIRYIAPMIAGVALLAATAVDSLPWRQLRIGAGLAVWAAVMIGQTLFYYPQTDGWVYTQTDAPEEGYNLFWEKIQTLEVLRAVDEQRAETGAKRFSAAVHPFWTNYHCCVTEGEYRLAVNADLREKLDFHWWITSDYRSFSRTLGDNDILLIAGEERDKFMRNADKSQFRR